MEFRILGPLDVRAGGRALDLGGARQRRVLAALLLNPDRAVPLSLLIEAAWDDDPPATAPRQVQNRVAALRKVLTRAGAIIDTVEGPGYRLRIGPDELDATVFEELAERGQATRDPALLRRALDRWRGPALAGLGGRVVGRAAARLDERRLAVWEECLELELAAGRHDAVVYELAALVAERPLRERLVGLWMTALHRCGRRDEALAAYRVLADRLAEELGIDPSPRLRRVHEAVLRGDATVAVSPATAPTVVPAQLPRDVPGFAGRVSDLAELDAVRSDAQATPTVVISAIAGTAGVGKTALAVHWAHQVRDKFPDGQLYVNLRGFDPAGAAKAPDQAIRGFLDALHVPPSQIPADPAAQAALFRSLLVDKQMLVVLDNARDADQVRPLLPHAPGCLVLVTSRNELADLVATDGARLIMLDLLTADEARHLLTRRLGTDRVAAEPEAVEEIITRCARLPLALAIVAARAASDHRLQLADLAGELRRTRGGLAPFTGDDPRTDVRAVFSWSYRTLTPDAARLFRLLGLHPGPDISASAAISLAGMPPTGVGPALAELARAHLIAEHTPGRYTFHDLLRAYAAEEAQASEPADQREAAIHRVIDHYLHTAHPADLLLNPSADPVTLTAPQPEVTPEHFADYAGAWAWFSAEYPVLLAAIDEAARARLDTHTWHLAAALDEYLDRRGHWHDAAATQRTALAATVRLADPSAQARVHRDLARAYARLGRFDDADPHLRHALDLYGRSGDDVGQAHIHHTFTGLFDRQGRHVEALDHARRAFELYRAAGHQTGQAHALNNIGWFCALLGDHQQALAYCQQSLALFQEAGHSRGGAAAWDSLGYVHHQLREYPQAIECYQHALRLRRDLGDRYHEAGTLTHLGDSHHAMGGDQEARDAWRQALAILEDLDHPDAERLRARLQESPAVPVDGRG